MMADSRRPLFAHAWEEEECLEYYGMIPLHRMFEVVGAQLTQNDVEVLSFLLEETQPWHHPLDPELWVVAASEEGAAETASPALQGWRKKQQQEGGSAWTEGSLEGSRGLPKDGVRLLLELERRGKCDETNFVQLLQLLRVLTRHDLLPYVTLKRQRTVSPERYTYGPSVLSSDQQVDNCLNSASAEPQSDQWEAGSSSSKRKRVSRGRAKSATPRRRRGAKGPSAPKQEVQTPTKVTCGKCLPGPCCVLLGLPRVLPNNMP
nr:DNA-binding death effector domain-containing protein 2 isoform X1 [Anolis sagrei ordinatus]